VEAAFIIRR